MKTKVACLVMLVVALVGLPRPATADQGDAGVVHRVTPTKAWLRPRIAPLRAKRDAKLAECKKKHRKTQRCRHQARRLFRLSRWTVRHPYLWGPMVIPDGTITRWDPCVPITYTIDFSGAAPDSNGRTPQDDWAWALARFESATGLNLVPVPAGMEGLAEVQVSWRSAPSADWEGLESTEAYGIGAPAGVRGATSATVTFNSAYDRDGSRREIMLHELGHLAGLGHVDDFRSVMRGDGYIAGAMTEYSIGDLAGLWAMGAGGGCW